MRVLVTGGGGFVGLAVAKALVARGDVVIALDSHVTPALERAAAAHANLTARPADVADLANVCQVFKADRPQAVVHCAAVVGVAASLGSPANVVRVNVNGALNLFEAMRLYEVKRILHVSSEETYGNFQSDLITEDHPQHPVYAYGITKVAVEHFGRTYRLTHGIECVNLRACWIYGPGLPRMRVPRDLIEAALAGRALHLPAGGDSTIDHTYIDDFVAGVLLALDHGEHAHDAYHIASGAAPSLFEMVEHVKALVPGAELSIGPGAYRHGGVVAVMRKGALDCTRAREAFGYQPRHDLRAGLAAYIEHYRQQQRD